MPTPLHRFDSRGFSMVELMVAMLIGLIGTIIIFQVFEVSEGIKRTTTGGGDAQQSGVIALYIMERDLRSAGMGFSETPLAGCNITAYDSKRSPQDVPAGAMQLVPVLTTAGAAATVPDQFTVLYGSHTLISSATPLTGTMTASTDPLTIVNSYGYRPGDLIVLLEPGRNCSLMEVTGPLPITNPIEHKAAGLAYNLASSRTVISRFNKPGGLGVAYAGSGATSVYNLGNLYEPESRPEVPVYNTYAIVNNSLTVSSAFDLDAAGVPVRNAVADNIVHMRLQYGIDDGPYNPAPGGGPNLGDGDGIVDRFVNAATFNAIAPRPWRYALAVRVALVARSALAEKPSGSTTWPNCDATTDATEAATPALPDSRPKWSGGTFDVSASGDPDPTSLLSWRCYRYRVFETTIPLRNWIWKSR